MDKAGKINMHGYGRVIYQTSTSFEDRPELADDTFGRLYYFFLDYRDVVKDHLDLKAGRTYVYTAAVSGIIDGLYLNFKNFGPVGVTLFGGRNVLFDNKSEIGTGGDALTGVSVYFDTEKNTHVEASYGRKYTDTDLARENVGLDFDTTPHEKANIYGRLQYDTVADKYGELLFGAKLAPVKNLILRGEYFQSHPTFDKFSFYSFFDVNNYKEMSIAAEYQVTSEYRVSGKYAREDFGGDATANLFGIGILARPIKDLTLNASYEKRDGYAGRLSGIRFNGAYRMNKAAISAGIDYDDFRRESSREGNAKKYWAGIDYELNKMFSAVVRVEDNTNFAFNHSYQGFAAVNVSY
ncbi:MAG: hypothetical protein E4G97_01585 [Deltaproteobacteria bacterium]|nr:MAG: hypothetical protein E4G97_01585 [Deltaproteobacteria bacterium]